MRPTRVRLPCDLGLKSVAPYFTGNRELGTGNGTNPRNNSTTRELENDEVTRQLDNSWTRELPKIYIWVRSLIFLPNLASLARDREETVVIACRKKHRLLPSFLLFLLPSPSVFPPDSVSFVAPKDEWRSLVQGGALLSRVTLLQCCNLHVPNWINTLCWISEGVTKRWSALSNLNLHI